VVPYKITWFRRSWVRLGQLIWAIVVPILGHLDVYSWFGGHCRGIIQGIREGSSSDGGSVRNLQMDVRSCPQQVWAVYGQFYRYRLSFTDIHMAFAGCLSGFTDTVQLFLVLATYCVVLGPFLLLSTLLSAR